MSMMESSPPPDDQLFYRATPSAFGPPGPSAPTPSTLFGEHTHFGSSTAYVATPLDLLNEGACGRFLPTTPHAAPHSPGSSTPSTSSRCHEPSSSPPTTVATPVSTAPPSTVDEEEFPTLKASPHPHGRPSPLATTPRGPSGLGRGGARSSAPRQNMAVKPSTVTHILNIVFEERRFKPSRGSQHLGEPQNTEQNRVCTDIMQKSGAHLELQSNGDNSLTVLVQGKLKQVEDAKRLVTQQLQTQASTVIQIPKEYHVALLGKGGQTLRAIEEASGARVNLPHRNEVSDSVRVSGSREAVAEACRKLQGIHQEQAKYSTQRLSVEKEFLPFIKGPNGQLLAGLEEKTGARVRFIPVTNDQGSTIEILVQGLREGVSQVVNVINSIAAEKKKSCSKFVYKIDRSKHRYIMGPRGSHVQEVLASTGVSIILPPPNAPEDEADLVTLFGPTRLHGSALTMVLDKANSMISETLDVPRWIHKHITKPSPDGVDSLKEINTAFPKIDLEFKREPEVIVIEGPPEDVQKVFIYLQGLIKQICQRVRILEIPVDPKLHPHIVGKGGIIINRIKELSGVENIRVPGDKGPDYVQLEGSPDAIAIAHREILDIVDKKENEKSEEIIMDYRYVPLIIGPNGEKIKLLRERFNNLVITIPRRAINPTVPVAAVAKEGKKDRTQTTTSAPQAGLILLRGTKNDVDSCKRYLEEMKKSFAQFVFGDFALPDKFPKTHPASQNRYKRYLRDTHPSIDFRFSPTTSTNRSDDAVAGAQSVSVRANDRASFEALKNTFPDALVEIMMSGVNSDPTTGSPTLSALEKVGLVKKCYKEFGAQVRFPLPRDADPDIITIFGPKAGVEKAKNLIKQSLTDLNLRVTIECLVEPKYFPIILGAKGARINELCQTHGVKIKMPTRFNTKPNGRASSDATESIDAQAEEIDHKQQQAILITGKMEDCQSARESILSGIPCIERLTVPPELHGMIIGPRGRDIKQFNGTYLVNLSVPSATQRSDVIRISGIKANVEKGKAALENLVQKLKIQLAEKELTSYAQEMEIDARHHRQLIGRGATGISQFCGERGVKIFFPNQGNKVRVVGNKEKVGEAVLALKERVEILENTVRESFEINSAIVPKMIGTQGRNIRQLMDKYQVEINTPRSETATTKITIAGAKDNVEQAKDYIQLLNLEHLQEVEKREDLKRAKPAPAPEPTQHPGPQLQEQPAPLVDTRYNAPLLTPDLASELNANSDTEPDNIVEGQSQSDGFEPTPDSELHAPASPLSVSSSSAETRSPSVERPQLGHEINRHDHDAETQAFDATASSFRPKSPLLSALSHRGCNGFHPSTQMNETPQSQNFPEIVNGYTNGNGGFDDSDGGTGDHCIPISDPEEPFLPAPNPPNPTVNPPTEFIANGLDETQTFYQQLIVTAGAGEKGHCKKVGISSSSTTNNGTCHHLEALEEEEMLPSTPNSTTLNGADHPSDGLIIV